MNPNQGWINRLKIIRDEQLLSIPDQCQKIGIAYLTFKKFVDPKRTESMKVGTLRKIRDYIKGESNEQD